MMDDEEFGEGLDDGSAVEDMSDESSFTSADDDSDVADTPMELDDESSGDALAAGLEEAPDEVQAEGEPEAAEASAAPAAPEDNLAETEGLLRDVPAPMVVELGRLRFNTAQIVRLKEGQALRLTRGPSDPVDLVVHGKVFARAELVDIDGELGVRILEIVGDRSA